MLAEPTRAQRDVLSAIPYSSNVAQLHTDESVLPTASGARASWNYWRRAEGDGTGVLVTYDLTRLQRLDVTDRRFLVTLNGVDCVDQGLVIDTMRYEHPLYTPGIRCSPTTTARDQHRPHRVRRAPTTGGASTRTARGPARSPPRRSGSPWVEDEPTAPAGRHRADVALSAHEDVSVDDTTGLVAGAEGDLEEVGAR